MKRHTPLLTSLLMLLLVSCDSPTSPNKPANNERAKQKATKPNASPYREIDIPAQEHGYRNFDTTVLRTNKELTRFLTKHVENADGWNKADPFKNALNQAEIDFDTETLVLVRNDATTGNVNVQFDPRIEDDQLVINVTRTKQGAFGPSVMQYFGYAVAVNPDRITNIRVEQNGEKHRTLQINSDNQ